jgi:aconitate hydratase
MRDVESLLERAFDPLEYRRVYADFAEQNPMWNQIPAGTGHLYDWDPESLYIREPPYFDGSMRAVRSTAFTGARALAIFDDSITTDHISPAGAIKATSPAGDYLRERGVAVEDFNSYGARRGNHEVMVRGTFANVRIRNLMVPGLEGGVTCHQPDGERMGIYEAAARYEAEGVPLIVIAGHDYGAGSSRDWAAKGTRLLGVRAVIAGGFERIHRSNLIGMGVLPCQLPEGVTSQTLALDGTERFDLALGERPRPREAATLHVERRDGRRESIPLVVRIDSPIEAAYFLAGGIMSYVLQQLLDQRQIAETN